MTNDVDVNRKARVNRTSGKLFYLAGLLFVLSGLIDGNIGRYIPIGMMIMCVGLMFLSMAKRTEKTNGDSNHPNAEVPDKADADKVG